MSGRIIITSPLAAGQETAGCALFQSEIRAGSRIPKAWVPGINFMAPLSSGQASM